MLALLALLLHLSPPLALSAGCHAEHRTRATRYADSARDEGGTPACWRRCVESSGKRCLRRFSDRIFDEWHSRRAAHRSLPCGTVVLLRSESDGKSTLGMILDRGPYGRTASGGYRGDLDLSPRVADAVGLNLRVGRLPVRWWVVGRAR